MLDADSHVLVLFCRRPVPGQGKQRLAAALGAESAHFLAEALLDCALEDAAAWPGDVVISPASANDQDWARTLPVPLLDVVVQPEAGFGERLDYIDRTLRARGITRITFIGSDAPALDAAYYSSARTALAEYDVVIGPAADGGVTLMGSRVGWRGLAELPWSRATLGDELIRNCRSNGWSVQLLAPSFDVDRADDLTRVLQELQSDVRPARRRLLDRIAALRATSGYPGLAPTATSL